MSIQDELLKRSEGKCELCGAEDNLSVYDVPPTTMATVDKAVCVCETCKSQIENPDTVDANHWRCLNESMWNVTPAVQVVVWRMLSRLKSEGWPQELLEMLYLDEETLVWAEATGEGKSDDEKIIHKDANGAILENGDTVTVVKDLVVKGAGFTAKRGAAMRNISLVADNAEQIEGRVEGQHIVLLTKYVKKST